MRPLATLALLVPCFASGQIQSEYAYYGVGRDHPQDPPVIRRALLLDATPYKKL